MPDNKYHVTIQDIMDHLGWQYSDPNQKGWVTVAQYGYLNVNIADDYFNNYSPDLKGNVYNFTRQFLEIKPEDERTFLKDVADSRGDISNRPKINIQPKKSFNFNNYHLDQDTSALDHYLVDVRGLHPDIVNSMKANGLLYQSSYKDEKNILFVHHDGNGKVVGLDIKGTSPIDDPRYKEYGGIRRQIVGDGLMGFNFKLGQSEKSDHLYIFESSIDALSYYQLHSHELANQNSAFVSMSGLKPNVITKYLSTEFLSQGRWPDTIHICTDNDQHGQKEFIESFDFLESVPSTTDILVEVPKDGSKDWNDQLRSKGSKDKLVKIASIEHSSVFEEDQKRKQDQYSQLEPIAKEQSFRSGKSKQI